MRAIFETDGIAFSRYPFHSATVYPRGRIAYSEIRDVDPDAFPPELRTNQGETLFISAEQADELREAITLHGLAVVRRVDVWGLLLEPFLDTSFPRKDRLRTAARLGEAGVSRGEVSRIRRSVQIPMFAYNAFFWDWFHLGLYDVLEATGERSALLGLLRPVFLSIIRRQAFYWKAMELAERGRNGAAIEPPEQKPVLAP